MMELGRVFNRKMIMILTLLCTMNLILFMLCIDPGKQITLTGEALEGYLSQYPVFLKNVGENGARMSILSMYKEGYAAESLKKTTGLYQSLEGTVVKSGENRGIVLFLQYQLTDLFLLAFLFLVVMEFQAERKKGLVFLVRSTVGGRSKLFLQRMAVLAFATMMGTCVFYGGNLIGIMTQFGVGDLSRSLQSLPEYMKCPYSLTIGEYLLRIFLLKMTGCFGVAVLFYAFLGMLNVMMAYLLTGILVVGEVLAGTLIAPISSLNVLRYVNLYTLIRCEQYYQDATFVNFFGKAVEAHLLSLWIFVVLFLLVLATGYVVHGRKYVVQGHFGERLFDLLAKLREKCSIQHTLAGWEAYKLLIKQKGFLILAAVFLIHLTLSSQYEYYYPVEMYERMWYEKFRGPLTEESAASAEESMEILKRAETSMRQKLDEMLLQVPFPNKLYDDLNGSLSNNLVRQASLQPILDDIRSGREYEIRTGNMIWLVPPYYYDLYLNKDPKTLTRASFLILVAILGALAGIFAFDRQNHVDAQLHSSYRGRGGVTAYKCAMVLLVSMVASGLLHLIQFLRVAKVDAGLPDMNAPVQSVQFLRDFPIYVSIKGFLILLFLVRMLMAVLLGAMVGVISAKSQDVVTSLGISTFVVIILVVLSGILPGASWINPIYLLGGGFFR